MRRSPFEDNNIPGESKKESLEGLVAFANDFDKSRILHVSIRSVFSS